MRKDERARYRHEYAEGRINKEMLLFRLNGRLGRDEIPSRSRRTSFFAEKED